MVNQMAQNEWVYRSLSGQQFHGHSATAIVQALYQDSKKKTGISFRQWWQYEHRVLAILSYQSPDFPAQRAKAMEAASQKLLQALVNADILTPIADPHQQGLPIPKYLQDAGKQVAQFLPYGAALVIGGVVASKIIDHRLSLDPHLTRGVLNPREAEAREILLRGYATVDEIRKACFGEWPPKGLDIPKNNTDKVTIVPLSRLLVGSMSQSIVGLLGQKEGNDIKNGSEFIRLLLGHFYELLELNGPKGMSTGGMAIKRLKNTIGINSEYRKRGSMVFYDATLSSTLGHETTHLLQNKNGGNHKVQLRVGGKKTGTITLDGVHADLIPNKNLRNNTINSYNRYDPKNSFTEYLREGMEIQARIDEFMVLGYQTWHRLPANMPEFMLVMKAAGLHIPDAVMERFRLSLSNVHDAFLYSHFDIARGENRRASEIIHEFNTIIGTLNPEGVEKFTGTVLPMLYGDLLRLYGDRYGIKRLGFHAYPWQEQRIRPVVALRQKKPLYALSPSKRKQALKRIKAPKEPNVSGIQTPESHQPNSHPNANQHSPSNKALLLKLAMPEAGAMKTLSSTLKGIGIQPKTWKKVFIPETQQGRNPANGLTRAVKEQFLTWLASQQGHAGTWRPMVMVEHAMGGVNVTLAAVQLHQELGKDGSYNRDKKIAPTLAKVKLGLDTGWVVVGFAEILNNHVGKNVGAVAKALGPIGLGLNLASGAIDVTIALKKKDVPGAACAAGRTVGGIAGGFAFAGATAAVGSWTGLGEVPIGIASFVVGYLGGSAGGQVGCKVGQKLARHSTKQQLPPKDGVDPYNSPYQRYGANRLVP